MAEIDRRSQAEYAYPSTVLMEDAGLGAWRIMRRVLGGSGVRRPVLVFVAGRGNNGGDALVMARRARVEGVGQPSLVLAGGRPEPGTDPGRMLAMCEALGIECLPWPGPQAADRVASADWIVDGIAGTGLRGPLRQPLSDLVAAINDAPARTIAVDVPSGIGDGFRAGQPAVHADVTLTMGLPKNCLYLPRARALCGRIIVVPVGFPSPLLDDERIPGSLLTRSAWRALAAPLPPDTHKNRRGHLAIFAGSPGTTGAAWLCAVAAARSRVGLVTLFADPDAYPVVASKLTSVMCRRWDPEAGPSGWDPARYTAVLAGPGWGTTEAKERMLDHLLSLPVGGVLDADGLTLLGTMLSRRGRTLGGRWVLTPHPGEFGRLAGMDRDEVLDDPLRHALAFSARTEAVVVLKGHCTVVASPQGRYWVLDGSNPALATGGAGDVLAGIVAAGCAAGLSPVDAALFGVSLHSHVAALGWRRLGWFLAEDLVPLISRALGRAEGG